MIFYSKDNVYEAALKRMRWLFDEFDNIGVCVSGGKDSTVVLELALIVAKEKDRLPLKVMFIDQEAEWQGTVDMVTEIMERPEVEALWFQMPILLSNSTSRKDAWLKCWDPAEKHRWMREKWPHSITENTFGTERFKKLFDKILEGVFPKQKACWLAGVRAEESPARAGGLTNAATYKGETWGSMCNKTHTQVTMYPIYDWSYTDVWTAIHKNQWRYNRIYDVQYSYGIKLNDMRVSNVHHETAIMHLFYMQEAEPETYEKLTQRIDGIDSASHLKMNGFQVKELPYMFTNWKEYRDYLLEHLVENEDWKVAFKKQFATFEPYERFCYEKIMKESIHAILSNDYEGTKLGNLAMRPFFFDYKKIIKQEKADAAINSPSE